MSVACFTREENNGIHVIFPVEGPMKQNCLLVNDSVQFVFDKVREGLALPQLRAAVIERTKALHEAELAAWNGDDEHDKPKAPDESKVIFDTYRTLVNLRDHGICTYTAEELRSLLPQGQELNDRLQIMPIGSVGKTSAFLRKAVSPDDSVQTFFALRSVHNLPPNYFDEDQIIRRHLGQQEVYFIQLDSKGDIEACVVVAGFAIQPHSLTAALIAGAHPDAESFRQFVGSAFARVCGLLAIVTLSSIIRVAVPSGGNPDVHLHETFYDMIGELGFRKSLTLPDELGPSHGVIAYDKTLF